MRVFGLHQPGAAYRVRPGAYGVILVEGRLAVARVPFPSGDHLPGGGVDPGESHEDALVREVYEETGLRVTGIGDWCEAREVTPGPPWHEPLDKHCRFYRASVHPVAERPTEPDHALAWIPLSAAWQLRPALAWAVHTLTVTASAD